MCQQYSKNLLKSEKRNLEIFGTVMHACLIIVMNKTRKLMAKLIFFSPVAR